MPGSGKSRYLLLLIAICLLIASCSGTRHLPPGEKLYTGAEIKITSPDKIRNKRSVKTVAKNAVRPIPNKSFIGLRPKLWRYMEAGENPKGKFKKWLRKTGEAPVLMSNVDPGVTSAIIDAQLFNIGYFNSYTEFESAEKKRTSKLIYTSHIQAPYIVWELGNFLSDDSIRNKIDTGKRKSLVKPGDVYNLIKLKNERNRIDLLLKNNGYFHFNPDYLLYKADTSEADHTIALRLTLKDSIPKNALTIYRINHIYIDQNYSLNDSASDLSKDTLIYQNIAFLGNKSTMRIRPEVISKSVHLEKNKIYSRKDHEITLNRLMSMGNFKFVRIKFSESDTSAGGFLDATILMTPMTKRSFRAEMDLVSKSNNYTGPRLNLSLLNRNTFNGAEALNLNLAGSYEVQLHRNARSLYSYSLNPEIELYFPRFLVPFRISTGSMYIPKTLFSFSFNYLKKVDFFDLRSFHFKYGFKWKENIRKEHELYPISVSNTSLRNKSAAFNELLAANPVLRKSYEEQFISGGTYLFTYNEQVIAEKKRQHFFQLSAEAAGNTFSLAKSITGKRISSDIPAVIAGSVYSQYVKLSLDGRAYYNFRDKNKLALRVFTGIAKPFGNAEILPYTKQFFSGGPNSIRAFHIHSVGPGTIQQNIDNQSFLQLGGEFKIELNAEYRFAMTGFLKGALFADAGNVWLLKSTASSNESVFSFPGFINEMAIGAGFGVRIDVSFIILRFDLAIPLRKPWLEKNHRWVGNQIDLGNSSWRRDNLILNIAIGYPF